MREVNKLRGKGSIEPGNLNLRIFNGSSWTLTGVTVRVAVRSPGGRVDSHRFHMTSRKRCNVLETGHFTAAMGFQLRPGQSWEWGIIAATGIPQSER